MVDLKILEDKVVSVSELNQLFGNLTINQKIHAFLEILNKLKFYMHNVPDYREQQLFKDTIKNLRIVIEEELERETAMNV